MVHKDTITHRVSRIGLDPCLKRMILYIPPHFIISVFRRQNAPRTHCGESDSQLPNYIRDVDETHLSCDWHMALLG